MPPSSFSPGVQITCVLFPESAQVLTWQKVSIDEKKRPSPRKVGVQVELSLSTGRMDHVWED